VLTFINVNNRVKFITHQALNMLRSLRRVFNTGLD
jgi:hypothetical protein